MKQPRLGWIAVLLAAAACGSLFAGPKDGRLDIRWIDVEGGAATLIVTPAGETILIDTGNPGTRDPQRIVKAVTQDAGLRRIDHLVITHYHRDHYGGATTLAELLPIGVVYDNGVFDGMPDNPGKAYFNLKCEKRVVVQPGDRLPLKQVEGSPPLNFMFLGCRKQFIEAPQDAKPCEHCGEHKPKKRDGSDNANSLVMLVEFGGFRFFDGGDLTWNLEQKLVCPVNTIGEVDVYQVTHHGLDSSNNPVLMKAVAPQVAVMNNGVTKGCLPEVFANLKALSSLKALYQVHKNERPDGAANNTGDDYIANHSANCEGNSILLTVASDGGEYAVTIEGSQHRAEYKTKPNKRRPTYR